MNKYLIEVIYDDGTGFKFSVSIEGEEHEFMAHLMQITRGTLMASSAHRATCYNSDGLYVCDYIR